MTLPSWLVPAAEIHPDPAPPVADETARAAAFVAEVVAAFRAAGAPLWQALEATGIACLEATWGRARTCYAPVFNLGGSKAKRDIAERYARAHGRPQRWFRAPGHVASGDPAEVVYLCWDSIADYCAFWLARHVGAREGVAPWEPRYAQAGALFWARFPDWIDALLVAGYRGDVTAAAPARSVAAHHDIVRRVRVLWAQSRLGVRADGRWGSASRAALVRAVGGTGDLDDAALAALAAAP